MSVKSVAILQSNYIPWKGYFDLINQVDEFILFDDMQYTRRDWRNRNKIKTPHGTQWLTIPVQVKGNYFQAIKDVQVSSSNWASEHWKSLLYNYKKAPFFDRFASELESLYTLLAEESYLSQINFRLIKFVCTALEITTEITFSMDYIIAEGKTERLVSLCQQANATHYLSGPSARDYIQAELFDAAKLQLTYMDYAGYPEYPQFYPPFEHAVTVLDLLFHTGPQARQYLSKTLS